MKTTCAAIVLGLLVAVSVTGQDRKNEVLTQATMQKKLEYSKNILEGLATEDFDLISKNAAEMRKLSAFEAFVRYSDAQAYRTQLQVFDFANMELIRAAEEKNLDGAALAFTQSTISCVNCHKSLRAKN